MKKMIFMALAIFLGVQMMAQTSDSDYIEIAREVLKTEKKAIISDAMQFSDQEAKVFWPLYNEYNNKIYEIENQKVDLIEDYAKNYDTMTNEKADEMMNKLFSIDQQLFKLKKTYFKKFKKILPAGKVVKYFQAENKIETLINAQLALEIPFVEVK